MHAGFQNEVDEMLIEDAGVEELEDWQRYTTIYNATMILNLLHACCRYVVVIIDEMKIRDDLVYNNSCSRLHGYINLGDVNDQLLELEQCASTNKPHELIASQILTVMIRGIFIKLEFPYASFPTQGIATNLYEAYLPHAFAIYNRCYR